MIPVSVSRQQVARCDFHGIEEGVDGFEVSAVDENASAFRGHLRIVDVVSVVVAVVGNREHFQGHRTRA